MVTACARATRAAGAQEMVRHNRHLLVSPQWLAANPDSVHVIHVGRTDSAYLHPGHIPGARFLPLSAVSRVVNGLPVEFPPVAEMAAAFGRLQVGDTRRIVIYGEDGGLMAARAWTALDIMGHGDRAALLDGGLLAWRAGPRTLTTETLMYMQMIVPFTPRWQAQKVVNAEWVQQHLDDRSVLFVDVRPADQYAGAEPSCPLDNSDCPQISAARRGHIPGAVNIPWLNALQSPQMPVTHAMHQLHHDLWEPAGAGRLGVRTIVTYCRTGLQASHAYWQARYIGYADVRLYDGSFIEWSALDAATHPVER